MLTQRLDITFLRHAETEIRDGVSPARLQLNSRGDNQARKRANRFVQPFDLIICSAWAAAMQTAGFVKVLTRSRDNMVSIEELSHPQASLQDACLRTCLESDPNQALTRLAVTVSAAIMDESATCNAQRVLVVGESAPILAVGFKLANGKGAPLFDLPPLGYCEGFEVSILDHSTAFSLLSPL